MPNKSFALLFLMTMAPLALAAEPKIGDTWIRGQSRRDVINVLRSDYQAGTSNGSSTGNPNSDQYGNSPWRLEWCKADYTAISTPTAINWYQYASSSDHGLLVWDSTGTGGVGPGRWLVSADRYPSIATISVTHYVGKGTSLDTNYNVGGDARDRAPMVKWIYPGTSSSHVWISGRVVLSAGYLGFTGYNFTKPLTGVCVIAVHRSGGAWEELGRFSMNAAQGATLNTDTDEFNNTTTNAGGQKTVAFGFAGNPNFHNIIINPGDEIIWSVRSHVPPASGPDDETDLTGDYWTGILDSEIAITVIPTAGDNPCPVDFNGDGMLDFFDYLVS